MKLLVLLVALLLTGAGNPPPKPSKAPARKPAAVAPASFQKLNLTSLWLLHAKAAEAQVMLGCMGAQYRRLDLVYEKVRRDGKNPALYHVQGKSRERERIMPFSGTITLATIRKVTGKAPASSFKALAHYQATGRFSFVENPAQEGSGQLTGTLTMSFSRTAEGLQYMPAQGSEWDYPVPGEGARFTSTWTSATHPDPVKVVWATNFMDIADSVIERFRIGDRGVHINPKYARMGWSRYWENDEWWAEEPAL